MAFAHPLWLVLLIAPVIWLFFDWRRTTGKPRLILKAIAIALIITALAEPRLDFEKTKVAVAVLADTSASVTPADLQRASDIATQIEGRRGSNVTQIIPFARNPRQPMPSERNGKVWNFQRTPGDGGRATSLERAVSEAVASLPAGLIRRVALISDGNENTGSIVRATWQAQQLGIPIDTFPLSGRAKPGLRLELRLVPRPGLQRRKISRRSDHRDSFRDQRNRRTYRRGKEPRTQSSRAPARRESCPRARQSEHIGRAGPCRQGDCYGRDVQSR